MRKRMHLSQRANLASGTRHFELTLDVMRSIVAHGEPHD
jgi:hypothetical protein